MRLRHCAGLLGELLLLHAAAEAGLGTRPRRYASGIRVCSSRTRKPARLLQGRTRDGVLLQIAPAHARSRACRGGRAHEDRLGVWQLDPTMPGHGRVLVEQHAGAASGDGVGCYASSRLRADSQLRCSAFGAGTRSSPCSPARSPSQLLILCRT